MGDVNKLINWFKAREGKVTYSMNQRYGPNSYDCSSSLYNALIEAGFLPAGTWPGNTESLYRLEGSLLQPISRSQVQRGDIFVSGQKGGSSGGAGHTGVATSNSRIIHCNGTDNGIRETAIADRTGSPCYWYRLKGASNSVPAPSLNKNGIAIDNVSKDQATHMVALIQSRYAWTLATEQVKAVKQKDGRYTLVITCDSKFKYEHSVNRLKQELKTLYPGYMQQNIAIVDGDKPKIRIEARNMPANAFEGKKEGFDIYMRKFLCNIILSDQVYGEPNAYGTWDVRVKGEGFNSRDAAIVLAEIKAEGAKKGIKNHHIKAFKY